MTLTLDGKLILLRNQLRKQTEDICDLISEVVREIQSQNTKTQESQS